MDAALALGKMMADFDVDPDAKVLLGAHASARACKQVWKACKPAGSDAASARRVLAEVLEKLGYCEAEASTVLEALECLTRDPASGLPSFKVTFQEFCAHLAQLAGPPRLAIRFVADHVPLADV